MCMEGGIARVAGYTDHDGKYNTVGSRGRVTNERVAALYSAIQKGAGIHGDIPSWNDNEHTKKKHILEAIDNAIKTRAEELTLQAAQTVS